MNVAENLINAAFYFPDRCAVVEDQREITYAEFNQKSARIASALIGAGLQPGEKLVDLGAGDGRIVITAARHFRARAVGIEIDPLRCLTANLIIRLLGLQSSARVHYADLFNFDISDANVVALYLTRETNQRLKEHLEEQLPAGARVVSHAFPFPDWNPTIIDDTRLIFVYEVGNTGPEVKTRFA